MSIGYEFRAYPPTAVASTLIQWIGCQRFIKNAKVIEDRYFRKVQRNTLALAGQYPPIDQCYAHFIGDGNGDPAADTQWLRDVPATILRNGAVRFYKGYQRFFKGLARRPTIKSRHGRQSVWLTKDVFEFIPTAVDADGVITDWKLVIGCPMYPVGELPFKAHRKGWVPPKTLTVSVHAGRWHISFTNTPVVDEDAPKPFTEEQLLAHLRHMNFGELASVTKGIDRNVGIPLVAAGVAGEAQMFDFSPIQKERMAKADAYTKTWQRKASKRVPGSKNQKKAYAKAARKRQYNTDVKKDLVHKTSHTLASGPSLFLVFEALGVIAMTKKPKAKIDVNTGKWLRNGAAAKAGLTKGILRATWGMALQFTKYKSLANGKLAIEVPAHYTSQECFRCGFTHAENRVKTRFCCLRCDYVVHADINAPRNIAVRGIELVLSGAYKIKEKKKVGGLRGKSATTTSPTEPRKRVTPTHSGGNVGPVRSEVTSVETKISREKRKPITPRSVKQKHPGVSLDTPCLGTG